MDPMYMLRPLRPEEVGYMYMSSEDVPATRKLVDAARLRELQHWEWEQIFSFMEEIEVIP